MSSQILMRNPVTGKAKTGKAVIAVVCKESMAHGEN